MDNNFNQTTNGQYVQEPAGQPMQQPVYAQEPAGQPMQQPVYAQGPAGQPMHIPPVYVQQPTQQYVQPDSPKPPKKKGKGGTVVFIIILIIVLLGAGVGAYLYITYNNKVKAYDEKMSAGDEYMGDDKYSRAVKEYNLAIEIDATREEAYLAIAEAYVAMAEEALDEYEFDDAYDYYDEAIAVLKAGIKATGSEKLTKKLDSVADDEDYAEDMEDEYNEVAQVTDPQPEPVNVPGDDPFTDIYEPDLPDIAGDTDDYETIRQEILDENGEGYSIGQIMPDFSMKDSNGNYVNLSDLQGEKAIYLNACATWCYYCCEEMPDMVDVESKYSDDILFVLLDVQETPAEAKHFQDYYDVDFPIMHLSDWYIGGYEIEGIPLTFVLNKYGQIVDKIEGQASYRWIEGAVTEAINDGY